jgi:2',3'-cyclic-nucleotide 2'-phosphodiesterase (5'-nucleotidase family)
VQLTKLYLLKYFNKNQMQITKRRDFIKKVGLAGASLVSTIPIARASNQESIEFRQKEVVLTILQTTDVHCQIHTHDELFWEDNKPVFRKTGGYARLASYVQKIRKENKHVFITDTGDMFQGSALSVKTSGKAIAPILNTIGYDLYLPGNWEVIYGKKTMQQLLGGLRGPKQNGVN